MPQIYGIDFGTCSSCISLCGNVLCNKDGYLTTPTKVFIPCDQESKTELTVVYFKRLIGLSFSQFIQNTHLVEFFKQFVPEFYITLHPDTADELAFFLPSASHSKYYSMHQIITSFLKSFLHDIPALNWNEPISAVITVPANYDPLQRNFVQHAFESVGVDVVQILNEPTAALYAHSLNTLTTPTCVLVLDCGGGTTDISVIDVNNNVFNVLHTWGDPFLGGNDLTQYIVEYLMRDSKYNLFKNEELYKNCETAKHQLSSSFNTRVSLGSSHLAISRAKFEDITVPFWNSIKDVLHQLHHIYNYSHVILVGGSTKTPRFADLIAGDRVTILRSPNPTYTVSIGASLYAETLCCKTSDNILIDILGYNLGVELHGGIMCPIITKLTSLPVSKSKEFSNTDGSDSDSDKNTIKINVYAGERYLVKDNHFITTLTLSYPDDSKELFITGNLRILVTFSIDTNGLLSVTACDKSNKSITVSSSAAIFSPSSPPKNREQEDDLDDDMDYKMLDAQLMKIRLNSQ